MRRNGATRDYKDGPKNNWRQWMWNKILQRTNGFEQRLPSLYLAGSEDNDRRVATDKGVPAANLIAVDLYKANVVNVKRLGNPALHEDIYDVLDAWPHGRAVAAVVLDFCGGLTEDVMRLNVSLARSPLAFSVKAMNFQRGRDSWSNCMRSDLINCGGVSSIMQSKHSFHNESIARSDKNRAVAFMVWQALLSWQSFCDVRGTWQDAIDDLLQMPIARAFQDDLGVGAQDGARRLAIEWITSLHNPVFHSYKSDKVVFDSVVYDGARVGDSLEDAGRRLPATVTKVQLQMAVEQSKNTACDKHVKQRIGAMLAVRSRNMKREWYQ